MTVIVELRLQMYSFFLEFASKKFFFAETWLNYMLNNGTLAGEFTILQADNVANLQQIDDVVTCFSHRVALQADERGELKAHSTIP